MTDDSENSESELVFHWPAMGVENGEYVGHDGLSDEFFEGGPYRGILILGVVLAQAIGIALMFGLVVAGMLVVDRTVGFGAIGGVYAAVAVLALGWIVVDVVLERVVVSPFVFAGATLAATVVVPAVLLLSVYRDDSQIRSFGDVVDALEHTDIGVRAVLTRLLSRSSDPFRADGGKAQDLEQ